jgi:hypothetical protein
MGTLAPNWFTKVKDVGVFIGKLNPPLVKVHVPESIRT